MSKLRNKIIDLYYAKQELAEAKEKELTLRKEVANLILGKEQKPYYDYRRYGEWGVSAERKIGVKVKDKNKLMTFSQDPTIPDVVTLEPKLNVKELEKYPENHEIWKYLYREVSPTPEVNVEFIELPKKKK